MINIEVPKEKLIDRLTGRRVCKGCGATFHLIFNPPAEEGKCDKCGEKLFQRADDSEETVINRLNVYEKQTAPLIEYYSRQGIIKNIDGDQPIEQVLVQIGRSLGRNWS